MDESGGPGSTGPGHGLVESAWVEPSGPDGDGSQADADARALASTLRLRILRLCLDEAKTNKELAQALGRNPATMLHHVRTLVARGFLRAEPTRPGPRGSQEVPYFATRKSLTTTLSRPGRQVLVDTFLEELGEANPDTADFVRMGLQLDDDARAELADRLTEVLMEFRNRPAGPGASSWSVFVAIHDEPGR